jgi:prepilin-type processing-associated H-X9-DG protein
MKVRVLPFIEQSAVYNSLNQSYFSLSNTAAYSLMQSTAFTATVNAFLCPSDGNDPGYTQNGYKTGQCNYGNNIGTCLTLNNLNFDGPAYRIGDSKDGPVVTLASVTDGTSNTAMWSEWVKGKNTKVGRQAVWTSTISFSSSSPYSPAPQSSLAASLQAVAASCTPTAATAPAWDQKGASWAPDYCGTGGGYSHLLAPNKTACFFSNYNFAKYGPMPGNDDITMIGAQSNHSGGVNVCFLDGSVKFIKDSVSLTTWGSIATRNGGEVVSADAF